MAEVKLIELRDRATFIAMVAVRLDPNNDAEQCLIAYSGFGADLSLKRDWILFGRLDCTVPYQYDPYNWNDRTYPVAHKYIYDNWDTIKSGDVVDVEYVLGETPEPKQSQRLSSLE